MKRPEYGNKRYGDVIGIDVGFKGTNWIVDSNNVRVELPDFSKEEKKLRTLNKKLNRQVKIASRTKMHGRSKNRQKTIKQINKYAKRIRDKKVAKMYDYISHEIVDKKPLAVVIEDLKIRDLFMTDKKIPAYKRKIFNDNILNASISMFQQKLEYICNGNGIKLIKAERGFPSTQRCHKCGAIHKMNRSRIYRCDECGMVEDMEYISCDELILQACGLFPGLVEDYELQFFGKCKNCLSGQ